MGNDSHELSDGIRPAWSRGILHFVATAVNSRAELREFRLKSGPDRRMVLTSAVWRSLGTLPAELPPLFLWQREGSREHAVALSLLTGES
jgi:hypothetical protein